MVSANQGRMSRIRQKKCATSVGDRGWNMKEKDVRRKRNEGQVEVGRGSEAHGCPERAVRARLR